MEGDRTPAMALLHDVVEDTNIKNEQIGRVRVEIAKLVDGVTKLSASSSGPASKQVSNLRRCSWPWPGQRVVIIRLADRLHNLRTLDPIPLTTETNRRRDSRNIRPWLTGWVYGVLWELEDLL